MHTDLKKTLVEISRCLPAKGEPDDKQLHRMYDLTLRLLSQELGVIYDRETFGSAAGQEGSRFADRQTYGANVSEVISLTIHEPLPAMKKLTEAVEEHWKAMLHAAISDAAEQGPLPHFERALVEIEIVTPKGSDNARVWDTSNRAIQVILNNLKGIFFHDDDMEHMAFSVTAAGAKPGLRSSIFHISIEQGHQFFRKMGANPWDFENIMERGKADKSRGAGLERSVVWLVMSC